MRLLTMIAASMTLASASLAQSVLRVPEQHGSIQAVIDASVAGDIVLIGPGTYFENVPLENRTHLTLRSMFGPWSTVIDASGFGGRVNWLREEAGVTIEGLQIGGGQTQTGPGGGVHACNAQGFTIRDCMITANTSSGSGDGIPDDCDRAADFDNDGIANTLDVLVFLNLWTAGC